jgi:Lipocalin-like domain
VQSIGEQLIGAWRLASYHTLGNDGSVVHPMGEAAVGFIMYLPDGFMSANLMVPARPLFSGGSAATATQAELAAAAAGYFGYAGRFEVDEPACAVRHHIEVSLVPNLVGTTQLRHVAFEGTRLVLRGGAASMSGRVAAPIIIWERVAIAQDR